MRGYEKGFVLSDRHKRLIEALRKDGVPASQIARQLGVSKHVVQGYASEVGAKPILLTDEKVLSTARERAARSKERRAT